MNIHHKYYVAEEVNGVYWIDESGALMFAPIERNHVFDISDEQEVDEKLIGNELIYNPHAVLEPGEARTYNQLYKEVREALGVA